MKEMKTMTQIEISSGWDGLSSVNKHFIDEIIRVNGDEKIVDCIQCGVCSGSCPVRFAMNYSPMQVIRMAQLGMKETVFSANTIWICATCYCCSDRCPRGIDIGDMMTVLRNLAIKEGHIRPLFEAQGNMITEFGRIWSEHEYINELRTDVGLAPISTINLEELTKLMECTNVKELLKARAKED